MIDLRGTRWQEVYSKDDLASEIHRLAAPTELEQDAARYRWLRDHAPEKWAPWADERDNGEATPSEIDAAIDADREGG